MKRDKNKKALTITVSAMGIVLCIFLSIILINADSAIMLAIFNLLFITLTFYLDGTGTHKAGLLLLGNTCGFFWNYLFFLLSYTGTYYIGESFKILCAIISPFLNVMWTVFFWSISLTALSRQTVTKIDNRNP